MIAIYISFFVFYIFLINVKDKSLFSPATIVAVTWCIFPAIACTGVLGLYKFSLLTHIYILLASVSFIFSYVFTPNIKIKSNKSISKNYGFSSDKNINFVNYKLLIILNLIIAVWLFSKLSSTISVVQDRGFAYLRGVSDENFSNSTIVNIIYQWFAKPFVIASCAILSVDLFKGRNKWQIPFSICVIINILLDTFVFAARATIVRLIIYFFFSLFFCKKRKLNKWQTVLVLLLIVFLLIVVVFMTNERMVGYYSSFSFLDSISMYYIAPFGLLNYYVEHPDFSLLNFDGLTFGSAGLGFIYNIFRSFLYIVFGLPYNGSDYIIQLVTQQSIRVGDSVRINSAYTAVYVFLRDFGVFGVVCGFSIFGCLISIIKRRIMNNPTVRTSSIYVFFLYVIFRLAMSYDFLSPSAIFTIIFILICTQPPKTNGNIQLGNNSIE